MKTPVRWLIALTVLLSLSACKPLVRLEQPFQTNTTLLSGGTSLGQTFVSDFDGLAGVQVYLEPYATGSGEILLHLRPDATSQDDLAVARLPVKNVKAAGDYLFSFSPQPASRGKDGYFYLEIQGGGGVLVGIAPGSIYLDGALYADQQPIDVQMTFGLVYSPRLAAWGVIRQGFVWFGMLLAGIFLYILPGWAVLRLLWTGWGKLSWAEKAALAGGMSLAIYPLLFLWTSLLGLHLGVVYALLPGIAALAVLIWCNRSLLADIRNLHKDIFRTIFKISWTNILPDILLVLVLGVIFAIRFWSVRSLDVPMWGDSYQHTVITQLMLDNGGMFSSWQPYAALQGLTYHFGFHAAAAVFGWLARLPATRAVLWSGQLLNGLAVLAVYPLASKLGRSRRAGLGAVLLAGLLVKNPMSYVDWGRYTQLAGLIILPLCIYLFWECMQAEKAGWKSIAAIWITFSGLALTHYRVLIFALLFLPVYFLAEVRRKNLAVSVKRLFVIGLGAFILFLPWFIHVYGARVMAILQTQMTTPAQANSAGLTEYNSMGNLFSYLPAWVWFSMLAAIGWGLWQRKKDVTLFILWWFVILLAANPAWLNLPGTGILSNFAVFIAAYIPAGVLLGAALGWGVEYLSGYSQRMRRLVVILLALLLLGLGVWGGFQRLKDVDVSQFSLVTRPDVRAAAWIRQNTAPDSRFVVNFFFAYLGNLIVGSDGGWWLPLLAERQTNLPPLTYGIEDGTSSVYYQMTNALATEIKSLGITSPQVVNDLVKAGFTHIYIGQRQGQVNNPDPAVLDPQILLADPHFQLVYQQDRVWIFTIVP